MRINEVEEIVGITAKNIRFYEAEGLISPKREAENKYRNYSESDIALLKKIKLLRELSVPIEKIKELQNGEIRLAECMDGHINGIEEKIKSFSSAAEICSEISMAAETFEGLDPEAYEKRIAKADNGAAPMGDIKKDIIKEITAPSAAAALFILLFSAVIAVLAVFTAKGHIPFIVFIVLTVLLLALIGGVSAALLQRIKEIKRGEEDEAFKY